MRYFRSTILAFSIFAAGPALAQQLPGSSNLKNPNDLQPKAGVPDLAPAAVPGAIGTPGLHTAPIIQKQATGDPTAELFTAVNAGDYSSAQDAISRGADLGAQDNLGETALDLSIALNRNTITFLILSARNEAGGGDSGDSVGSAALPPSGSKVHVFPAKTYAPAHPVSAPNHALKESNPGTPDPSAGFLGFGSKN